MNANELILFDQAFKQRKKALKPSSSDATFFEFFSAEQVLRDYPLSPDDIESGIVGQDISKPLHSAGSDGGLDSMYVIVNGKLIRDVDQAMHLQHLQEAITFDVIIIQSKLGHGFKLAPIIRLQDTLDTIFNLSVLPKDFSEQYNAPLTDIIQYFRAAHLALLNKSVDFNVRVCYAARADSAKVHSDIIKKAKALKGKVCKLLDTITSFDFDFIGAKDLVKLARRPPLFDFSLNCVDSISDDETGYIALVTLEEYYRMISDGRGIREHLFDANVRDYQGEIAVNENIRLTLENTDDKPRFWWLNNGITILADTVTGSHRKIHMTEPRIVNGLQTSQVIFNYLRGKGPTPQDKRYTVIKIIQSPDAKIQDKVIKATNSQTQIPIQFLRASEDIQRDLEAAFKMEGLHYDRRKNSWRKALVSIDAVVGMTELVQSVASIVLQEPDHARARPSRYFRDDSEYKRIFPGTMLLKSYVICAVLKKRAQVFLKEMEKDVKHRNNLIFYVLMAVPHILRAEGRMTDGDLAAIDVNAVGDETFEEALSLIRPIYEAESALVDDPDQAAKGATMVDAVKTALQVKYRVGKKAATRKRRKA